MGIIFNENLKNRNSVYISRAMKKRSVSPLRRVKRLTLGNRKFLESLGLTVLK